jgi:AbrB family looped-hinge helix DNA binding protein
MSDIMRHSDGKRRTAKPKPEGKDPRQRPYRSVLKGLVRQKGVVTIPQTIRQQLDLEEGDEVIFSVEDGKIVLTPATVVPRDQMWFWTPDWQAREAEADADLAAGNSTTYDSDEEFLKALKDA